MTQFSDKMIDWKKTARLLAAYKYPLLLLLVGILLMLLPTHTDKNEAVYTAENALEELLADSAGVGRIRVIVSENGAVVVCEGADNAAVRLDILRAIGSYTSFGSDKITVLKMSNLKGRST